MNNGWTINSCSIPNYLTSMPCMYPGEKSNSIIIDGPNNRCIRVNTELYIRFRNNNEQNTRVGYSSIKYSKWWEWSKSSSENSIQKWYIYFSRVYAYYTFLVYIIDTFFVTGIKKMSSDEFKLIHLIMFLKKRALAMTFYQTSIISRRRC